MMTLVLAATVPSCEPEVIWLRKELLHSLGDFPRPVRRAGLASVVHVFAPLGPLSSSDVYVGLGFFDCQQRPSLYANPYFFTCPPDVAYYNFSEYILARPDLEDFVRPLAGSTLVCDCELGEWCHAGLLAEMVNLKSSESTGRVCPRMPTSVVADAVIEAHVEDGGPQLTSGDRSEDSDGDDDASYSRSVPTSEDLGLVDETMRGSMTEPQRGVAWPEAWCFLVAAMRAQVKPVMWELFAGVAVLSMTFYEVWLPGGATH